MSFEFDGTLLTSDRTLVNGQKVGDMGVQDGSLTVYNNPSGTGNDVVVNSDMLRLIGGSSPTTEQSAVAETNGIPVVSGQEIYTKTTPNDAVSIVVPLMLLDRKSADYSSGAGFRVGGFYFNASGEVVVYYGPNSPDNFVAGTYTGGTEYECKAVLDVGKIFYYIKGGNWTSWTLLSIDETQAIDPVFITLNGYSGVLEVADINAPEDLYPELVTPIFHDDFNRGGTLAGSSPDIGKVGETWASLTPYTTSITNGGETYRTSSVGSQRNSIDTGVVDGLFRMKQKYGSTGASDCRFALRYDTTNWLAVYTHLSNNTYAFEEYDSGSLVQRATGSVTITTTPEYLYELSVNGLDVSFNFNNEYNFSYTMDAGVSDTLKNSTEMAFHSYDNRDRVRDISGYRNEVTINV